MEVAARTQIMIPCGHVFACDGCVTKLAAVAKLRSVPMECSFCREPVTSVVKIRQM
jgi:hypothetical protein